MRSEGTGTAGRARSDDLHKVKCLMLTCSMKTLRPYLLLLLVCASSFAHAQNEKAEKDTVYDLVAVATQPEFPGGQEAMYVWIRENTAYPDSAFDKRIQGKVYVQFDVKKDGHIGQVVLRRGINQWLDEEAVRVVGKMPVWKPGRLEDGTAVPVRITIPFDFKL